MKIKNNINSMLDIPPQYWNTIGGGADTEEKKPSIEFEVAGNTKGAQGQIDVVVPIGENIEVKIGASGDTNTGIHGGGAKVTYRFK